MLKEQNKSKMKKILIIFFIGAFVGFIYEVIFYFITEKRLDNAGILYGPWLPIYGAGACLISLLPNKIKKHPLLLFTCCIIATGLLEYLIGWITLEFFHQKLWDYSGLFLNIQGFVCLRSVLTFAIGGLVLVYIIEPTLEKLLQNKRYSKILTNILYLLIALFISDFIISKILKRTPFLY